MSRPATIVIPLRQHGHDAIGVATPFAEGAALFRATGHPVQECMYGLDSRSTAPFVDSRFHFITSWETVEHLRELEGAAAEWGRLAERWLGQTRAGGDELVR